MYVYISEHVIQRMEAAAQYFYRDLRVGLRFLMGLVFCLKEPFVLPLAALSPATPRHILFYASTSPILPFWQLKFLVGHIKQLAEQFSLIKIFSMCSYMLWVLVLASCSQFLVLSSLRPAPCCSGRSCSSFSLFHCFACFGSLGSWLALGRRHCC